MHLNITENSLRKWNGILIPRTLRITFKYCIKILMNAFYGKHIQSVNKHTGKVFNPVFAALITSKTRIKLLEFALKNPDKIIEANYF